MLIENTENAENSQNIKQTLIWDIWEYRLRTVSEICHCGVHRFISAQPQSYPISPHKTFSVNKYNPLSD